jgi:hypothetical protein
MPSNGTPYPHFKPNRNNMPSINTLTQYFIVGIEYSETQPTRLGSPGLHFSASSTILKRAMWEYVSVAWIWITWLNKPMLRKNPELVKDVLQAVWWQIFLARGCLAVSSDDITDEMIQQYVEERKESPFKIMVDFKSTSRTPSSYGRGVFSG